MKPLLTCIIALISFMCRAQITGIKTVTDSTIGVIGDRRFPTAMLSKSSLGYYDLYFNDQESRHANLTFKGRQTLISLYNLLLAQFVKKEGEKTIFHIDSKVVEIEKMSRPGRNENTILIYVDGAMGYFTLQQIELLFDYCTENGIDPNAPTAKKARPMTIVPVTPS